MTDHSLLRCCGNCDDFLVSEDDSSKGICYNFVGPVKSKFICSFHRQSLPESVDPE